MHLHKIRIKKVLKLSNTGFKVVGAAMMVSAEETIELTARREISMKQEWLNGERKTF
jgi:hypothetical protein